MDRPVIHEHDYKYAPNLLRRTGFQQVENRSHQVRFPRRCEPRIRFLALSRRRFSSFHPESPRPSSFDTYTKVLTGKKTSVCTHFTKTEKSPPIFHQPILICCVASQVRFYFRARRAAQIPTAGVCKMKTESRKNSPSAFTLKRLPIYTPQRAKLFFA